MGAMCKTLLREEIDSGDLEKSPREEKRNPIIEEARHKIMDIPIFNRRLIAEKKYEDYLKNTQNNVNNINFVDEYTQIIELLLLNETDKRFVRIYLSFLKENGAMIKNLGWNTYNEEINKYKIIFTKDEMDGIEKGIKTKSERIKFIEFIDKLSKINENNFDSIYIQACNENIKFFNYPIEFSNQELFYYKLYILLIMRINSVRNNKDISNDDKKLYILEKSKIAKLVIREKILENKEIINNEDKMNILIIILLYENLDNKGESINLNRLLQTQKVNYEELYEYINTNKIGSIIKDKNELIIKKPNSKFFAIIPEDVCMKNLSKYLDYDANIYVYNTLDSLLNKNDIILYVERIKKFLNVIIKSKAYKEAIKILFPKNYDYLLNLTNMKKCIESRLKFYPYQNLNNSGITDKFSCTIYIPIIFEGIKAPDEFYPALKVGAIVDDSLHEINHVNQNLLYFRGCDKSMFYSPKRPDLKGDGGKNLVILLFGEKIVTLSIIQCFYILNEDNYDQSLNDFKKNFQNVTDSKIKFSEKETYIKNTRDNAIFKDFFNLIKDYTEQNFDKLLFTGINTKYNINYSYGPFKGSLSMSKIHCKMPE